MLWTLPVVLLGQPDQNSPDRAVQGLLGPSAGAPAGPATTGTTGAPAAPGASQTSQGLPSMLLLVLPLLLIIILGPVLTGRKEKKKRALLMSSIKKHDRVQTIGGIIGIVSEVRDDEIVLKVDETSNTKIRFARSAIQQVLKSSDAQPAPTVVEVPAKSRSERATV